jgi:glutaminyl-peptide cyclotransferase
MKRPLRRSAFLFSLILALGACNRKAPTQPSETPAAKPVATQPPPKVPTELWTEFDGERALANARQQVECGPRPSGSPALEKARGLIIASLEKSGWVTERQELTDRTPHGPMNFTNLVARYAGPSKTPPALNLQKVLIGSHYDSKFFSTISFVGANDGASSTGALLELARTLALDPAFAAQFELVFFDGEEAIQQFSETDGLYGSRFYAKSLRDSGRAKQFHFGIIWDMIGDSDLSVTLPLDSPREMVQGIFAAAEALSVRKAFRLFDRPMLDDHVPLNSIARIPSIDIIDFDYDPWHTADDTLKRISATSMQTVGAVTIHYLKQTLR